MITDRSTDDLLAIARSGGGLALDAGRHSVQDLKAIAGSMQAPAQLILRNTGGLSIEDMTAIAGAGSRTLLFAD